MKIRSWIYGCLLYNSFYFPICLKHITKSQGFFFKFVMLDDFFKKSTDFNGLELRVCDLITMQMICQDQVCIVPGIQS